ncbi:Sialidase precursor [Polystyrenella longa]|uniref:Sialidase n=1 Tax=Polystyrenella longa TaxID=2528007 RepID=A0A518CQ91_9PLAN|nr:sialidase family protein [Polystyrenella longa]QDU81383.1 Sialidase precursor [Polystyrenella longa]
MCLTKILRTHVARSIVLLMMAVIVLSGTITAPLRAEGFPSVDRKSLVYKGIPPNHCCVDQVLRYLPNGEMGVFFVTGGTFEPDVNNHIRLCRSSDQGETWLRDEEVLKLKDKACLLTEAIVHEDTITLFVSVHDGRFENWTVHTIASEDNGQTWGELQPFTPLPRKTFIRNLYRASWGEWILPFQTYAFDGDASKSIFQTKPMLCRNGVLISNDQGKTWTQSKLTEPLAGWGENNVAELTDGRLVMLVRADGKGHLDRHESSDRGRTWSERVATKIPNPGSKFRLFNLSGDRIALVHNPNSKTSSKNSKRQANVVRNPMALWISKDDLQTWGYQRTLTDFPGMLAYPDGEVDPEEKFIHFVFDYNRHDVIYWGAALPAKEEVSE